MWSFTGKENHIDSAVSEILRYTLKDWQTQIFKELKYRVMDLEYTLMYFQGKIC